MATTNCSTILKNSILNDCTEDFGKGFEQDAYLMLKSDIDLETTTRTGNIITTLTLQTGKKAFKVHSPSSDTPFTGTTSEGTKTTFGSVVDKTVSLLLMANSPYNSETVDALRNGKYVLIVENVAKGVNTPTKGDQAFEVFGFEQGLTYDTHTKDPYNDDSNGGYVVIMKELQAKSAGVYFFKTDYTATKAALESMLTTGA